MKRFSKFFQESTELDEAVEVSHDRYMRSHGKKASGGHGTWMFTHKRMGDVNVDSDKEVHAARGKFSDAKKSAQQWAKRHGHSTVYVMEEVELDEVSDKKLDAYRQKAFADQPSGDDGSDKYRKRKFGRDLAFAKQTGRAKVLATKEEVEQISERIYADDYKVGHEKSQFGGYRPHVTHKKTGKTMYLGQAAYKTPEHAKGHANAYLKGYETAGDEHASRKGMEYQKANSKHLYVMEEVDLNEASDPRKVRDELKSQGKHKEAGEHAYKHGLGRSYGQHFGMRSSKNSAEMEFHKGYDRAKAREDRAARLKNKEDGNRMFMGVAGQPYKEEVEQIDELKKSTLGSYIKKASARAVSDKTTADRLNRRAFNADDQRHHGLDHFDDAEKYFDAADRMQKKYKNRLAGIAKATDRLTKEEVEQINEYNTKSSKAIVTKDDKPVAIYPDLKSAQKDYYGKDGHAVGMRSHSAAERIRKANPGIKIVESVEQIDEISADLAHDVYKKRMAQAKAHVQQDNYSAARKAEKKAGETSLRMVKKILRREETELDNGYIESTNESVEMSMNQRKALEIGRKLQMMATKEKNDTIANAMANLGDHLESFGATFGPKNMSDLMKKTGLTKEAITMLIQRAQRQ